MKITYIESNGTRHEVEGSEGQSVMEVATQNLIPGILGDCGGTCSCATCHTYVDPDWLTKVGTPDDDEQGVLEGALEVRDNSRLSCQIKLTAALDGIVLHLPERQY
ncbi:2Fe-2S iron-sulfur cluster-binding protein [Pseudomonas lopnurensis]|uniref:2Fe-2S iron-sulfur cluster-binding protein n=1 Tax=Pseudomonas lopnurensis TaxID=1477517 RepID=UPI0028ADDB66|nr:2Fe-2S iron-sulfur cluster-binding protein [Pseudomonas lopnurensis]